MDAKKRVLFVDDDQEMLYGIYRMLRPLRSQWEVVLANSGKEALSLIREQAFDAVVTDMAMPEMDGIRLIRKIHDEERGLAIVMLTGRGDESIAVSAMKAGAHDYLCKGSLTLGKVQAAVGQAIEKVDQCNELKERSMHLERMSEKLAEQTIQLSQLSRIDPLTALFNRRAWEECISNSNAGSKKDHSYSIIMIDVDYFKAYNDALGHPRGDEVLCKIADCLRGAIGDTGVAARHGGEEFAVLLPKTSRNSAARLADCIRESVLDANISHPACPIGDRVTVSLGVASGFHQDRGGPHWRRVLQDADKALYAAKRGGRNRVSVCNSPSNGLDANGKTPPFTQTGAA